MWRNLAKIDLMRAVGVSDGYWYGETLDRKNWRKMWSQKLEEYQQKQQQWWRGEREVMCSKCVKNFRRENIKACHKNIAWCNAV